MIKEPNDEAVAKAFAGTNFGGKESTAKGRLDLLAECVIKTACGFHSGHTITEICKELGLRTAKGSATKAAKHWAYCYVFTKGV